MIKDLQDRVSNLKFEFPRVRDVVDNVPTMLIESMSRDLKVLRREFDKSIARNNELEVRLDEMRREMDEMRGLIENKTERRKRMDDPEDSEAGRPRRNILSVSHIPLLKLGTHGVGPPHDKNR